MKKLIVLFLLVVLTSMSVVFAQPDPDTLWTLYVDGFYKDEAFRVRETSDGGYIVVGRSSLPAGPPSYMFIVKIDHEGDTLWTRRYGGDPTHDCANDVREIPDGGYVIAGYFNYGGHTAAILRKIDNRGDTLWTQSYWGGFSSSEASDVLLSEHNGFYVTGNVYDLSAGEMADVFLMETDSIGNVVWSQIYVIQESQYVHEMKRTGDGGFILVGLHHIYYPINNDCFAMKIGQLGELQWWRTFGGLWSDRFRGVTLTDDGGYAMIGRIDSHNPEINYDIFILKTDSQGDSIWGCVFGDVEENQTGVSIEQTSDGCFMIAGWGPSDELDPQDFYLAKVCDSCQIMWER